MTTIATETPAPETSPGQVLDAEEIYFPTLSIDLVRESKTNPRKTFDPVKLQELADSVRTKGVLSPIRVRPVGKGKGEQVYEVVFGARRFRASKLAGRTYIPAIARAMSDQDVLEAQTIENLQRDDLHPLEEAEGYRNLMASSSKYNVQTIAEHIGKTGQYVRDRLRFNSLIDRAKELFRKGEIGPGHAVPLSRLRPEDQERCIERGLFTSEQLISWDPEDPIEPREHMDRGDQLSNDDAEDEDGIPLDGGPRKAVSVRELQSWIDKHVRFDTQDESVPHLFPETAATLEEAAEVHKKVVRVTMNVLTPEEAKKDGARLVLGRSWKRADGKRGSYTCDHSIVGLVDIGPGRGDTFLVCTAKKACKVHWAEEQKRARQAAASRSSHPGRGSSGDTDGEQTSAAREKGRQAEERAVALAARWVKAVPAVTAATVAALKKAPAGATSALGKLVLDVVIDGIYRSALESARKLMSAANDGDGLVRILGCAALLQDIDDSAPASPSHYGVTIDELGVRLKPFGVDVRKVLDEAAPEAQPTPDKKAGAAAARPVKGKAKAAAKAKSKPAGKGKAKPRKKAR